jgi:protein tyrosine/serine phosphatase
MKVEWKTSRKVTTVIFCIVAVIVVAHHWYMDVQGNFHPITTGEAYRSAQLDRDLFEYYIHEYKIRSIINLRGKKAGEPWYEEETETSRKLGVKHYDLGLSAVRAPASDEIEDLLQLFRTAPRPVLIHCQAGADRSGLAGVLWKMVIDDVPKSVAKEQLSIRYGHLPFGPTQALDLFLENWVIPIQAEVDS